MGSFLVDFALVFGGFIVGSWLARRGHGGDQHKPCVPIDDVDCAIEMCREGIDDALAAYNTKIAELHQAPKVNCCHCAAPHCLMEAARL